MATSERVIVAGIATLDREDPLLLPVLELANSLNARLHLVHMFEAPSLVWDTYANLGHGDGEMMRQYTNQVQARLEANVASFTPSGRVDCRAVAGTAGSGLADVAGELNANLLIVGPTRRGTLSRTILGTTAQRVLRRSNVAVLVLRPPLVHPVRRVLFAIDLSELGASVHKMGLDLVHGMFGHDPALRALFVAWYDASLPPPLRYDQLASAAKRELDEFLGEASIAGAEFEPRVRVGDPPKEIIAETADWDADLLVMARTRAPG
jgi:nucleotide-binding universal stress UspA family protein